MLKNIIKHEFKATYRTFLPINITYAIVCGILYLLIPVLKKFEGPLIEIGFGFGMLVIILGIVFVVISPFLFLSMRFYKTTATREAYLTFTVPAKTSTILLGKFITALAWTVGTLVIWLLGIMALGTAVSGLPFDFSELFFDKDTLLYLFSTFVSIINSLLMIFAAISLSQLVRDHRILASFGFYAALYTVQQIVSVLAMLPYFLKIYHTINNMPNHVGAGLGASHSLSPFAASSNAAVGTGLFVLTIGLSLVFCVVNCLITHYMLNKKLNLL